MSIVITALKMENKDVLELQKAIQKVFDRMKKENPDIKSFDDVVHYYKENGLGNDHVKRAMWDMFWATDKNWRHKFGDEVLNPQGLIDKHIDSALRFVVKKLK